MLKSSEEILRKDEDSPNDTNELSFISSYPNGNVTKDAIQLQHGKRINKMNDDLAKDLIFLSQDPSVLNVEEIENEGWNKTKDTSNRNASGPRENLVDEQLAFIAKDNDKDLQEKLSEQANTGGTMIEELKFMSQPDESKQTSQNSEKLENNVLSEDLAFISNNTQPGKALLNTDDPINVDKVEDKLVEHLAFISQDPLKDDKKPEDATNKEIEENVEEEWKIVTKQGKTSDEPVLIQEIKGETMMDNSLEQLQFVSKPSTKRKSDVTKSDENAPSNGNDHKKQKVQKKKKKKKKKKKQHVSFRIEPTEMKNPPVQKKAASPMKHLIATLTVSVVAVMLITANLRAGLHLVCPYDDQLETYIVMEEVKQCPVRREIITQEDDHCDDTFWRKNRNEEEEEELFDYIPAPAGKTHELLCRRTFNMLHIIASLLHPRILHHDTILPEVKIHSPCPAIIKSEKKSKKTNPMKKFVSSIACLFRKKAKKIELAPVDEPIASDVADRSNELDWAFLVSVPLELNLTPNQLILAKRVAESVRKNVIISNVNTSFEEVVGDIKFSGKHPMWFPLEDDWGGENEFQGLRLIAAYMKIMEWPEDLVTNFPMSGVCSDGCPADFAITNTFEFKQKYKPEKMTPAAFNENKDGFVYVRGYSPTRYHSDPAVGGASILWLRPGLKKMENAEAFSRALLNALETCIADTYVRSGGKIGKCNVFLDCDDVGFSKILPIGPTKSLLKKMQDNYPDKLGVFVIANVSGAAQMFLKLVLPLLPQVVRQKIHIIPNDKEKRDSMLKELVHKDFIPTRLGGKDDYTFSPEEFYKSGRYEVEFISDAEGLEFIESMPYYSS